MSKPVMDRYLVTVLIVSAFLAGRLFGAALSDRDVLFLGGLDLVMAAGYLMILWNETGSDHE